MKKIIRKIITVLNHREKRQLSQLIVLDVMISFFDIVFLVLLLYIINLYSFPGYSNRYALFVIPLGKSHPILLIATFFCCLSVKNLLGFLILSRQNNFVYNVASRISKGYLENYLHNDYLNYVQVDSSVYIRKIGQEPIEFGHYVLSGLQQIISQSILIVITIVAMLLFNAVLFLLLFVLLLPSVILMGYLMKRWLSSERTHTKKASEKSIQYLQEALSGFIESNVYNKHSFFTNRYWLQQQRLNTHLSRQLNIQGMPSRLIEIFAVFGLFILMAINSLFANTIQIITIGAFMAAAYKIIPGIVKILNSIGQIKSYEFTIQPPLTHKQHVIVEINHRSINEINSIELENISFSYEEQLVFRKFNMHIQKGDLAGISSVSGKGKTTLVNLLLGFLNPDGGTIYINGELTDLIKRQSYWQQVTYVKQQPFLIHDTLLKNITLDEKVDQIKLSAAIEKSGLEVLLEHQAEGYDFLIEENGKNISGGQRQRIVLARAFYKESGLLILDEPFKELDEISEIKIIKHLQSLAAKGKIVILVTHNTNSLSYCNNIISLADE